jgi:hypothetical protein
MGDRPVQQVKKKPPAKVAFYCWRRITSLPAQQQEREQQPEQRREPKRQQRGREQQPEQPWEPERREQQLLLFYRKRPEQQQRSRLPE